MFLNERLSGFRAVATAISPLSRTSWTRWLPKPVDVPVMKKTRGMMADVPNDLVKFSQRDSMQHLYTLHKGWKANESG